VAHRVSVDRQKPLCLGLAVDEDAVSQHREPEPVVLQQRQYVGSGTAELPKLVVERLEIHTGRFASAQMPRCTPQRRELRPRCRAFSSRSIPPAWHRACRHRPPRFGQASRCCRAHDFRGPVDLLAVRSHPEGPPPSNWPPHAASSLPAGSLDRGTVKRTPIRRDERAAGDPIALPRHVRLGAVGRSGRLNPPALGGIWTFGLAEATD